jgi:hypothetical protein
MKITIVIKCMRQQNDLSFNQTFGAILLSAHYLSYGLNGIGLVAGKLWGRIFESGADMVPVLLIIFSSSFQTREIS